ncbi:hypothetical protein BH11PLA2_BH11PLA2_02410 [soil metagenome]
MFAQKPWYYDTLHPRAAPSDEQMTIAVIVVLLCLGVMVFGLAMMHRCLNRCSQWTRTLEPWQIWLNLVPLLWIVWMYVTCYRMTQTLRREFADRRFAFADQSFGQYFGYAGCVLMCVAMVINRLNAFDKDADVLEWAFIASACGFVSFGYYCYRMYIYGSMLAPRRWGGE